MRKQLIIFILFLSMLIAGLIQSCKVTEQKKIDRARIVAYNHPNEFAQFCADKFKPIDSIGKEVIRYVPADNKDYKLSIDSLVNDVIAFREKVEQDTSAKNAEYKSKIESLTNRIYALQKSYKKCVPDTLKIKIPIYIRDTAKEAALAFENKKVNDELLKTKTLLSEAKKSSGQKNYVIAGLAFLFFGTFFLWIRKRN